MGNQITDEEKTDREQIIGKGERLKRGRTPALIFNKESDGAWMQLHRESQ